MSQVFQVQTTGRFEVEDFAKQIPGFSLGFRFIARGPVRARISGPDVEWRSSQVGGRDGYLTGRDWIRLWYEWKQAGSLSISAATRRRKVG